MTDVDKQFKKLKKSYCIYVRQLILLNDSITFMNSNISPPTVRVANGHGGHKLRARALFDAKYYAEKKDRLTRRFKTETKKHIENYIFFLKLLELTFEKEKDGAYHTELFLTELERDEVVSEAVKHTYVQQIQK